MILDLVLIVTLCLFPLALYRLIYDAWRESSDYNQNIDCDQNLSLMVWIVGKVIDIKTSSWEFGGIFDTEEKAVSVCYTDDYFTAEVEVNSVPATWPCWFSVCYYPRLETKEEGTARISKLSK